ncbi:MAG: hypothetical protein AB7P97_20445 [Hyphomonadaceae bacterium]
MSKITITVDLSTAAAALTHLENKCHERRECLQRAIDSDGDIIFWRDMVASADRAFTDFQKAFDDGPLTASKD